MHQLNNIQAYLGNSRYIPFRLRRYGSRTYWNVTTADRVQAEFQFNASVAPLTPLQCSRSSPGADWNNGLVPCLITPADVTARVGSYSYTVSVVTGILKETAGGGVLEILPRPAPTAIVQGETYYVSTNIETGTTATGVTIPMGAPVARTSAGIVLADASDADLDCDGISIAASSPGYACLYIPSGSIRLENWSAICGTVGLPGLPGDPVYLDFVSGRITSVLPSLPDSAILQVIGEIADDAQTLALQLNYAVNL
jgi:hypothetical protein